MEQTIENVPDEAQRRQLQESWERRGLSLSELAFKADEFARENARLRADAEAGRQAVGEARKLREQLAAAQAAQREAERRAQVADGARAEAEAKHEELLAAARAANAEQSRLERVLEQHDR